MAKAKTIDRIVRDKLGHIIDFIDDDKEKHLKPCPFCGKKPRIGQMSPLEWYLACNHKECMVQPRSKYYEREREAIDAWNRRAAIADKY